MENSATAEDATTKAIEEQTKKIPSDIFLATAIASMALSFTLKCFGRNNNATFIGQWAAPILIMGVYNKLVKQENNNRNV